MKKYFTPKVLFYFASIVLLFANANFSFAQTSSPTKTSVSLVADDGQTIVIKFETGSMIQKTVTTPIGEAVIIKIDEGTSILKTGYPDLPKLTSSIIVPDDKNMQVTVTGSNYTDYQNIMVAPSKGSLKRDIDPATVPYTFGEVYQENSFFPKEIAELRDPYILRDFRGQTVIVYPFQYNAVTKTLRVYSDITVSVSPKGDGTAINVLKRNSGNTDKVVAEFSNVYSNHFLNYETDIRYDVLEEEGNMLIISDGSFMNAMQPFIDWKIQKGLRTEMVDIATIGNNKTSIKNFVTNYYNENGLTFLLLVGDDAQVKSSSTSAGDSDNDYGFIAGDDHYQEIFIGRFSAQTEAEVTTQVNRTISYEKTPLNDSYFSKGICMASNEGAGIGDDDEADYEHEDLIRSQLLDYTYTEVAELFDGTHGNVDEPGNPSDTDLEELVNTGAGIINYTGHGSTTSLGTTGFNNTDVNNLTNTAKWPFLWIVGCSVGDFTGTTCFSESWARATYNGEPSGAVASFMSTILQSWAEPMEAQDEMNLILTESYTDNIKRTFGGLSINGCFSMNDKYSGGGIDMTDTWVIFGDPSVVVRTAQPSAIIATHDPSMVLGSMAFNISCDAEGALAALTVNGTIIATATVSGGIANLTFDQMTIEDTLTLTITGYNKVPYIASIPAFSPASPYVIGSSYVIDDVSGNDNGLADYNEEVKLDATLQNLGLAQAVDVSATIATTDPYITVTDGFAMYGTIADNAEATQSGAFAFWVADDAPDAHTALFTCTVTDNASNSWSSTFSVLLNAPSPLVQSFEINDMSGGNGDGFLDPSETATITVYATNDGHSDVSNALATLTSTSSYISISNASSYIGDLLVGVNSTVTYDVVVAPNAPFGIDVPFTCEVTAGAYTGSLNFTTAVSPAIEDFETNDFSQYDWQLNDTANWFTTPLNAYEGGYCSQSGNVNKNASSTLQIVLDVQFDDDISFAHKVSSEGNYDFLKFYIDGTLKDQWSGELDWAPATYGVTTGEHTFKWTYSKDGYFDDGLDCAWIDNIVLPAFEINTSTGINPGPNGNSVSVFPNPFEKLTLISYNIGSSGNVSVVLYNESGQEVKKLVNNQQQSAGNYQLAFNGSQLPGGIYLCKVIINEQTIVQKIVLSK